MGLPILFLWRVYIFSQTNKLIKRIIRSKVILVFINGIPINTMVLFYYNIWNSLLILAIYTTMHIIGSTLPYRYIASGHCASEDWFFKLQNYAHYIYFLIIYIKFTWKTVLLPRVTNISHNILRNRNNTGIPLARTPTYQHSFITDTLKLWNNLYQKCNGLSLSMCLSYRSVYLFFQINLCVFTPTFKHFWQLLNGFSVHEGHVTTGRAA